MAGLQFFLGSDEVKAESDDDSDSEVSLALDESKYRSLYCELVKFKLMHLKMPFIWSVYVTKSTLWILQYEQKKVLKKKRKKKKKNQQ